MIGDMALGILFYLVLKGYRFMRGTDVDPSNAFNFLRVEFMDAIHPINRAQTFQLTDGAIDVLLNEGMIKGEDFVCPYDFIAGDEFSDHFPQTRPKFVEERTDALNANKKG